MTEQHDDDKLDFTDDDDVVEMIARQFYGSFTVLVEQRRRAGTLDDFTTGFLSGRLSLRLQRNGLEILEHDDA